MMAMRPSMALRTAASLSHNSNPIPKVSLKFTAPKLPEGTPVQTHINPFVSNSVSYIPHAADFKRTASNIGYWAVLLFSFFSWTFIYKGYEHAMYGRASAVEHNIPPPNPWYKKYTSVFN